MSSALYTGQSLSDFMCVQCCNETARHRLSLAPRCWHYLGGFRRKCATEGRFEDSEATHCSQCTLCFLPKTGALWSLCSCQRKLPWQPFPWDEDEPLSFQNCKPKWALPSAGVLGCGVVTKTGEKNLILYMWNLAVFLYKFSSLKWVVQKSC